MNLSSIWVVATLAVFVTVSARTAQRQQPVTAHITSLNDKDAVRKAATHPAFTNAGRQAGVEVWRIENFEPVPVSQKDNGKFHKGDSYIVLKTTSDKRNNLSWDIHYWIGAESSQDESGAAAILTVGLDDKFGGAAVQHRETQGYESRQFMGYFTPAIRYLDGGVASGFNHVTTNAGAEKRMFQVKGKRNVRVRQVDPVISSMNQGDVFILDKGNDILMYVPSRAKNVEKLKAISVANQIRDQDHHGRGRVEIIDQYSSQLDIDKFFTTLGSGSKDSIPEETAGGDDQTFEKSEEQLAILSEVSDSSGKLKVTPLSRPFKQEQLKPQESYILDTVSGSIYVWVGKQSTEKEKSEAMSKAQQYLSSKNYPSWVHIAKIPQGTEPAIFKQYFQTWRDVAMAHNRLVRSVGNGYEDQVISDEPRLFEATLLNDNTIKFEIMDDFTQADLETDEIYVLDTGDKTYLWIGKEASARMRKAATLIVEAFIMHHSRRQSEVVLTKQGLEPESLVNVFREWDPYMWQKIKSYTEEKEDALRFNKI